jgi:periplasmic divalent cation tolerance protein
MEQALLVLTNLADMASARLLARTLVEQRLPAVQSVYRWNDVIEEAAEVTLLIKTTTARYAELEQAIRALHPYALPEVIAVPVTAGSPAYLGWIVQETRKEIDV